MRKKWTFLIFTAATIGMGNPSHAANVKSGSEEYFLRTRGRNEGPINRKELEKKYVSGEIDSQSYIWSPSLPTWVRIGETRIISDKAVAEALANRARKPASTPTPPDFPAEAGNRDAGSQSFGTPLEHPYLKPETENSGSYPIATERALKPYFRAVGGLQGGLTFPYAMQFTFGGEIGARTTQGSDIGIHVTTFSATETYYGYSVSGSKTQISLSYTGGGDHWFVGGRFGAQLIGVSDTYSSYMSAPYFFTAPVVGARIPIGGGRVRETLSLDIELSTIGAFTDTFTLDLQSMAGLRISF